MKGARLAAAAVLLASASAAAAATSASASTAGARAQVGPAPTPPPASEVRNGRELYEVACSSCHGLRGEGTARGPTLIGVGAASADFYLTTGRMPLDKSGAQATRKPPAYSRIQIRQLVAYVASLGAGPPVPDVDWQAADLSLGNRLYTNNCASCHSSAGAGGALGRDTYAPALDRATPVQVAEAVRIGPGAMPRFGPDTFDDEALAAVVRYVQYLRDPVDRGGHGLGRLGPIPEGFVAWVVGLGAIVLVCRWIGTRD